MCHCSQRSRIAVHHRICVKQLDRILADSHWLAGEQVGSNRRLWYISGPGVESEVDGSFCFGKVLDKEFIRRTVIEGEQRRRSSLFAMRLDFSACGAVEPRRWSEGLLTKQSKVGFHLIWFNVFQRIGDLATRGVNDNIDLAKQGTD